MKYSETRFTYNIYNKSSSLKEFSDDLIRKAFKFWERHGNVSFAQVSNKNLSDFEIGFETGEHGDEQPFDGPGTILAHATLPHFQREPILHFDDDDKFTNNRTSILSIHFFPNSNVINPIFLEFNLLMVAVHEIGHLLGLMHSHHHDSIMSPFYQYFDNLDVQEDDVRGIHEIYGEPDRLCDSNYLDASLKTFNNTIYLFRGTYYWKFNTITKQISSAFKINATWPSAPDFLDAAYSFKDLFFFIKVI